jgi:DNA polymerase III subunit epsilon
VFLVVREIILDTETTGFSPEEGDRIIEIGCLELINGEMTGNVFHTYINPERNIPKKAFAVHGISEEFLKDKPLFKDVTKDFLAFIKDSPLVMHNAPFDMRFLNFELKNCGKRTIAKKRAVDTLAMAKRIFAGEKNSLDALMERFNIDASERKKHGAVEDCRYLYQVYKELLKKPQKETAKKPIKSNYKKDDLTIRVRFDDDFFYKKRESNNYLYIIKVTLFLILSSIILYIFN